MKRNPSEHAFLAALQSGLWGTAIPTKDLEQLDRPAWLDIFKRSFTQTVEGLVAESVRTLPDAFLPPQDILLKWLVRLQRIEQKNAAMNQVIARIFEIFEQQNIHAVLQKGHGVSLYYDKPDQRVCGDIDLFFPDKADYYKANAVMKDAGEQFSIDPAFSSSYLFSGMEIEHHQRLVQLRNPLIAGRIQRLHSEQDSAALFINLSGKDIPIPAPLLNIIQVQAHILKHQVTYGIGLRQLCDAAQLYDKLAEQFDGQELKHWYQKLGMLQWAYTFHEVLVDLLALDRQKLPFQPKNTPDFRWMSDEIMRSGNFGFYDPDHPDHTRPGGRVNRAERLSKNFMRYVKLAPMEAISFPFFQVYSKIFRK